MIGPSAMPNGFLNQKQLGRSGLTVGRLGLGSSYGAPTGAYEQEVGISYDWAAEAAFRLGINPRGVITPRTQSNGAAHASTTCGSTASSPDGCSDEA